jgi:hypothetical protein
MLQNQLRRLYLRTIDAEAVFAMIGDHSTT